MSAQFTAAEKAAEAERECEMRARVYGRKGQLTPTDVRRIAIMQEIAEEYRALAQKEKLL